MQTAWPISIEKIYYNTGLQHTEKTFYISGVEGINKESRWGHVYPLGLREKLFHFICVDTKLAPNMPAQF